MRDNRNEEFNQETNIKFVLCYIGIMGKRKIKKTKLKRKSNFIRHFCITLAFALAIGLFGIFSYLWYCSGTDTDAQNQPPSREVIAVMPSENGKEEKDTEQETDIMQGGKYADVLQDEEYMEANRIYAKKAADAGCVTITFAGDILFDPNYAVTATLIQNGGDIGKVIAPDLIEEMQAADIMMLNNEFTYSDRGEALPEKQFTFRAKPEYVSYLYDLGVDIVSLANNHTYDYGELAFLDTLQTLKDAGMPFVGAGVNLEEAAAPVYFIVNDMKIAFVSATQIERLDNPDTKGATESAPGVFRCWNVEKLLQTVEKAKAESDFVIVYIHWGTENQEETDWAQDKQAHELVEAGADCIIGDHPHVLQRIEIINGVPVIYSLGNFWFNSRPLDTGMVKVTLTEDGLQSYQFIPCLQSGCRTVALNGEEKERALGEMRRMSEGVQIDADGYVALP